MNHHRNEINRFGRQIIYDAFDCDTMLDASRNSITVERLVQFEQDPVANGPETSGEKLDLTGGTFDAMKTSAWNQALIHRLALKAEREAADWHQDWHRFFQKRIHRILREAIEAKPDVDGINRGQAVRHRKFQFRMETAATMLAFSREDDNEEDQDLWAFVLRAVAGLRPDGMSDEEEGIDGEETISYVHNIDFRHPDFRLLFDEVDRTRLIEKDAFVQAGRKRRRRVATSHVLHRPPPPGLAPSYYNPTYLEAMRRGDKDMVELGPKDHQIAK
ncbi:hypothetical protein VNI00_014523 [Paramarasmius palmivorus]|uniref:Uncharacterized protein n=1 Tax=Paramarasmius palmivorus TaxID=297713 RepID=A0AAW0BRJ5_9AGAR